VVLRCIAMTTSDAAPKYHLAQYNIGKVHKPLDHPDMAEFTNALDRINELAEQSSGFVWRLTDESGNSSSYVEVDVNDPLALVNMSVWLSPEALNHFMYKTNHVDFMRRRTDWFEAPSEAIAVCWWIPAGTIPTVADGQERLESLRKDGPSARAWTLGRPFPQPEA